MEDQWVFKPFSSICPSKISIKGLLYLLWETDIHSPAGMGPIKFHSGSFLFFDIQVTYLLLGHDSSYRGPMEETADYVLLLAWVHLSHKNSDV
jgi:hypothetical protein